ncbi:hypothetical protein CD351_02540 [Erythrobacter sp. KY5]|nr:hypothetical protein CD351_02540 [Erythrobacter sp. KY5]
MSARVLIAGAGPAGCAIAHRLARRVDVTHIDAGTRVDLACDGTLPAICDEPYRAAGAGGGLALWGGYCADPGDDLDRPEWLGLGPELRPCLTDALRWLGCKRHLAAPAVAQARGLAQPLALSGLEPRLWQFSPVGEIGDLPSVQDGTRVLKDTRLVSVELSADGRRITHAVIEGKDGTHRIETDAVFLATGAIENVRILLGPIRAAGARIPEATGRGLVEHGAFQVTGLRVPQGSWIERLHRRANDFGTGENALAMALAKSERERLGLMHDVLHPYRGPDGTMRLGVMSEQARNPANRVYLSGAQGDDGVHRARVDWGLSAEDRERMRRSAREMAMRVVSSGSGALESEGEVDVAPHPGAPVWCGHPTSTTPMGHDARSSVVDRDGRLHGLSNLHLAGSGTFPSAGWANPTLLIVALAFRQADRFLEDQAAPTGSSSASSIRSLNSLT